MAKVKKYLPGAESLGTSFGDKAGAFMGNYGGAIGSAASSLMPLLMKKPDPNAKPYKKGSKLIKYQAGTNNAATDDPEDLHAYFGRILGKNKTVQSSNEPQGEVGPTRKEAADLMRTYNKANKNNPSAGPSKEELETGRNKEISENAERARKTYETRLDAEAARTQYEKEQAIEGEKNMVGPSREDLIKYKKDAEATEAAIKSGIPSSLTAPTFTKESVQRVIEKQAGGPVSTEKNPILYKESVKEKNPYISFKQMSAADQKKYRAGMASGAKFEVGGREYAAATPEEMAFSKRMETKGNKPVANNTTKQKNQNMDKYSLPGYKKYKEMISTPIWDNNTKQNTTQKPIIPKPTQNPAQIDSALNSINLPKFKNKNTSHPLEYRSKK